MSFDKNKPLTVVIIDAGNNSQKITLTKSNEWSMGSVGLWFYWGNTYTFYPWTKIVEMYQTRTENSTGISH